MAFAVGSALVGALLVALTLIPGLAYLAFRKPSRTLHNRPLERLTERYEALLARVLGKTRWVAVACGMALLGVVALGSTIGRDFLPYLDEGSLWLQVTMPPGITLEKATGLANELRRATREFPEVSYMVTQTGRNDDGTDPWTVSHIEASVGLHPYGTWKSGLNKQELIAKLAERYKQLPGFTVGFMQPMIDGVQDKLSGAHSDLVVKVYGDSLDEMRRIAGDVVSVLEKVPGAVDVAIDQEPPLPNLKIEIDRAAAARYGINVSDVSDLISTGMGGAAIGHVYVGEKSYDMTVRFPEVTRNDPDAIAGLLLTTPGGAKVPLGQVASIRTVSGETTITRESSRRHLTVKLNARERDLSSFLAQAQAAIEREVKYDHLRYQIAWGGQFENLERAQARLMVILPMTLALMFLLLFAEFGNLRQPAMVLLAVPLAMLGGLAALHLRGMTLNVSSAVGFIALFGVAVLNGVLMISQINRLRRDEGRPLREAVMEGARSRIRPVLVTATAAAFGLTPAMLAMGLGSDVQRPLATVVVGGLVTATLLTLVLLPALYHLIETQAEAAAKRRAEAETAAQDADLLEQA
jgi:cobalt-zinc-cadmium resistance protein CzcA